MSTSVSTKMLPKLTAESWPGGFEGTQVAGQVLGALLRPEPGPGMLVQDPVATGWSKVVLEPLSRRELGPLVVRGRA